MNWFAVFIVFEAILACGCVEQPYCNLEEIKSSCIKAFVCGIKKNDQNDSCRPETIKKCMMNGIKPCANNFQKKFLEKNLNKIITKEFICYLGGVDAHKLVKVDPKCLVYFSNCTVGYQGMWRNNKTDARLKRKFDDMKNCLKNIYTDKEKCNFTNDDVKDIESQLVNPFKACWGSTAANTNYSGSSTTTKSGPHAITTHNEGPPITSHNGASEGKGSCLFTTFTITVSIVTFYLIKNHFLSSLFHWFTNYFS